MNKKPYNDKTALFEVNPSTGTVLLELFPDLCIYLIVRDIKSYVSGHILIISCYVTHLKKPMNAEVHSKRK